jgi:ABC-type uncharacterized transport system involved in gliding motility auxiliary subunit
MNRFGRMRRARLGLIGLAVAVVLFFAVNVFATAAWRGWQLDLTENRLYTLSDGTIRTLRAIDEPVTLRLYFSRNLGKAAPRYATFYVRVREMLQRYADLAPDRLRLVLLDPEPFSDAEDRAVADGMQGVPVTAAGDLGYFGLAGSNSVDGRAVIPFFNLERESFLEFDLTKLVYTLAKSSLPKLGLLSGLPGADFPGPMGGPAADPLIFGQLDDFFEVERLSADVDAVPEGTSVLVVVDPARLSEDVLRAVDAFVQRGGRALVFVDPHVESAQNMPADAAAAGAVATGRLLEAWGVRMVEGKVAGDLGAARRVSTGARGAVVGDYVAWLTLGTSAFPADDPIFANVERINLASAGILEPVEGAKTTVTPVMTTGDRSMAIDVDRVRFAPDVVQLLRDFRPGGTPLTLAARITGPAPAAFSDSGVRVEPQPEDQATRPIDVMVVADVDMLFDRFWVQSADFFGEQILIPNANNADFVVNAIESLSGSEALIGLRGRGASYRPFTLIEEFRRQAELRYRAKEQELQARLTELQTQLKGVSRAEGEAGGEVLLTAEDRAAIERFRGEILAVRRQLRDVQHALRQDIERLESAVKVVNIGAVPLLVCIVAVLVAAFGRGRRRRARGRPLAAIS